VPDPSAVSDLWDKPLKHGDLLVVPNAVQIELGMFVDDLARLVPLTALTRVYNDIMNALEMIALELGFIPADTQLPSGQDVNPS